MIDFIAKNQTYHKAIAMAESEQAQRFQNPPRTFPKKGKQALLLEASKRSRHYNDKNVTEHSKALASLGNLFSYYNDRCIENTSSDPKVRRRVAMSVKLEKRKRVTRNMFLVPKTFEQIESYVTRLFASETLHIDKM